MPGVPPQAGKAPAWSPDGDLRPLPAATLIIITWNSRGTILRCLDALRSPTGAFPGALRVVDNASDDGTPHLVAERYPEVKLLRNARNLGFAAAANQALATVRTPFAVLLNPDTFLSPHALEQMVSRMAGLPDVGIASCRLVDSRGIEQRSWGFAYPGERLSGRRLRPLPVAKQALPAAGSAIPLGWATPSQRDMAAEGVATAGSVVDVAYTYGALMVIRMAALREVGYFDGQFFMYYEDADCCRRMRQTGWRVVLFLDIAATHLGGRSSQGVTTLETAKRYFRSEILFHRKHDSRVRYWSFLAKRSLATLAQLFGATVACAVSPRSRARQRWVKYRARALVLLEASRRRPPDQ